MAVEQRIEGLPDASLVPTHHEMLVAGSWTPASRGGVFSVKSPATGRICAELASGGPADIDDAVLAAKTAFERHTGATVFERAAWCRRVADVLDSRKDNIALELVVEQGKPIDDALAEVGSAVEGFRLAAEEAVRLTGSTLPVHDPQKRVMTFRRPQGVLGVITPWNFPINIPAEYLGPALATGNAVVWKPSPNSSRVAVRLAECIADAEIPSGLLNLVTGTSVEMAESLISHPDVVGIGFTGSSDVGTLIAQRAAGKRLLLELGGNGPVVVLADADLERTIESIGHAAFWNAGQSCAAAERIIAEPPIYDALLEGLAGFAGQLTVREPWRPGTQMGPVNNPGVADKMTVHVNDAVSRGATVVFGGSVVDSMPTALYLQPTVLGDVHKQALIHVEETFGPIAPVTRASGDEEILDVTNLSRLGLSAAIFGRDINRAYRLAERMPTGQVVINDTSNYWELHMPFGGWAGKLSGVGRIGGRSTLESMTEVQSISLHLL
jgi:acyl-CoA reductase-like NAD-dependent aldehyde dehydrogenase